MASPSSEMQPAPVVEHGETRTTTTLATTPKEDATPKTGHSHADGTWHHGHHHGHNHGGGGGHAHADGTWHNHSHGGGGHNYQHHLTSTTTTNEGEEDDDEEESPSIWSRLFFGSDQHSNKIVHDPQDDDSGDEDVKGIKLLGSHLAAVKLEAEERAYQDHLVIQKLEREKRAQHELLRDALNKVSSLTEEIKRLELQNTKKWQIENRDNWLAQLEALKVERTTLKRENDSLSEQLRRLSTSKSLSSGEVETIAKTDSRDVEWLRTNLARTLATLVEEREARSMEKNQCTTELQQAKRTADEATAEAMALKKKLDFELELKFNSRFGGGNGIVENGSEPHPPSSLPRLASLTDLTSPPSFLSTIVEVIAPRHVQDAPGE